MNLSPACRSLSAVRWAAALSTIRWRSRVLDHLKLSDLLDYTDWERQKWHAWFLLHGADVLKISTGPHGDGRFGAVGELVRHIFSAEKRYVERLSGRSLTDSASIPTDNVDTLFQFSRQSRNDLREFLEA